MLAGLGGRCRVRRIIPWGAIEGGAKAYRRGVVDMPAAMATLGRVWRKTLGLTMPITTN